ncbi:MAG: DUF1223 domain-containing protein [Cyclobacteriaceae bacterium]
MRVLLFFALLLVATGAQAQEGFAVIELFTSQGCSSCPPADRNLVTLLRDAKEKNIAVFGLSFHVDYWNYIGWRDPYSSKTYSERQRNYAKSIASQRVYTPQMIVNGSVEFVGSNTVKAGAAIQNALREKPKYRLSLKRKEMIGGSTLSVTYISNEEPHGEQLNIAVVEREVSNYVNNGENHGRTLNHTNVVKAFETISFKKEGNFKIDLSQIDSKASVIMYVQDNQQEIVAAYEVLLGDNQ